MAGRIGVGERTRQRLEACRNRRPWRSFDTVEYAPLEWVDWLNDRRLLEPIGNILYAEAEVCYYAMLDNLSMAANLKPNRFRHFRCGFPQ